MKPNNTSHTGAWKVAFAPFSFGRKQFEKFRARRRERKALEQQIYENMRKRDIQLIAERGYGTQHGKTQRDMNRKMRKQAKDSAHRMMKNSTSEERRTFLKYGTLQPSKKQFQQNNVSKSQQQTEKPLNKEAQQKKREEQLKATDKKQSKKRDNTRER